MIHIRPLSWSVARAPMAVDGARGMAGLADRMTWVPEPSSKLIEGD